MDERRKHHPTQWALIVTIGVQIIIGTWAVFKLTAQIADEHGSVIQKIDDIGRRVDRLENIIYEQELRRSTQR